MNFLKTILTLCLVTLSLNVYAAKSAVPLIDQVDIAIVTGSNKTLQKEQVQDAIRRGGATRGWVVTEAEDGSLIATILPRQHKAVVSIEYDERKYSIRYKDSAVLKYKVENGQKMIHPNYNVWVKNLVTDINLQLINSF